MAVYGVTVVTPPADEPLSLTDAKAHLKVDHSAEDTYIGSLIRTARRMVEQGYGRQLVTATLRISYPAFPGWELRLPRGPLQSVTSIQYVNTAGVLTTLDPSHYSYDATVDPAVIFPSLGHYWPSARLESGAVRYTVVCGYGDPEDVPDDAIHAMRLMVGHWFKLREPVVEGSMSQAPLTVDALLMNLWTGCY